MKNWLSNICENNEIKAMPVLSFPGIQLIGTDVKNLVNDGVLQAKCMKAVADRYDTLASVSLMDLSVEAEAFGSPVRFSDDEVPTVTARIIETEDDAENLKIPQIGDGRTGEYIKTISEAKKLIKDRPVIAGCIGPFSLAGRLLDMTEIMIMSITDPEIVTKVLDKCTAFLVKYAKAFKSAGADGLIIAEPAAGLLSPDLNSNFSVPYLRQIVEAVQDENFVIIYHNCGNTIPLINEILKIGANALHFGNSIELNKMLPLIPSNVIVMGNVNPSAQFRNGTPESIAKETNAILTECSDYENFVLSSGCDIPPMSPLENIDAFFRTLEEFNKKLEEKAG